MPLTWPKPLPLVFFAAVPLILMWAPARALIGAAVSKLPANKPRLLSSSPSLRRRRGGAGITAAKGLSCSRSSGGGEGTGDGAGKVIVIAGAKLKVDYSGALFFYDFSTARACRHVAS